MELKQIGVYVTEPSEPSLLIVPYGIETWMCW